MDENLEIESLEIEIKDIENLLSIFLKDSFSRPSDAVYLLALRERKIRKCSSLYRNVSKRPKNFGERCPVQFWRCPTVNKVR